jgi:trk system potassium uptake protein
MKIMVAGGGSVGVAIATDLTSKGYEVTVMEQDPSIIEKLSHQSNLTLFLGDACEVASLQGAGVGTAEVVVAATGDDEDNLVISWLAKQEFAVPRVVARVNNSKNQWLFNESWGVDVSVSTPQQLTALVEEAVSVGSLVRLLEFERATANLLEVTLAASSPAIDTSLGELSMPPDSTIVAIIRDGRLQHPDNELVLHEGDEVLVLVSADDEEEIQRLFVAS